jgi:hypothetical protein
LKIFIYILLVLSFSALQAHQSTEKDTIREETSPKFQIYLAPVYSINQFAETFASQVGISAGIEINNRIDVSFYYGMVIDDFKKRIIFPTLFTYDQMNGGLYLNYYFTKRRVRPLAGLGAKYGQISWWANEGINEEYTDHLMIYEAFFGGIWKIDDTFSLKADLGYTFSSEVGLIGLNTEDFQGIKFDVAIKICVFSF